ncbi:TIGR04219 family outer membrane beta-barrel protein [Psychromonas algicola]|uniref:TIGR04219 family outer membrane beta-barrel protein n=1 Tax=Psychromonas algicola TaxID=2555642 RepID=UPI001067B87D|nr:TIGR04219 family outer membrane beta-barrel protein [Psychromonas sp. RZ5]TEW45750.1 TIGR04219 family outer membrane beta-barrel protein [Psychromonas sp. RZ5]
MKKTLLACLIASTSFSASADFLLGGDIEVNAWQQNQTFRGNGFAQEDDTIAYTFEASLEHFIPLIPNPKISRSSVEGKYYEYTKTDATLYYEFFDNDLISIDAGVGLTQLTDGSVRDDTLGDLDFSGVIPHLYAAAEVGIPFTPFFVYAKGTGISYADNEMLDASVGVKFSVPLVLINLEFQGGYRTQTFNLVGYDSLNIAVDAETSGLFAGVNIDF